MKPLTHVATILMAVIVVIVAGVGGAVVIWGDGALSFAEYVDTLKNLAIGVGVLGVGRGIMAGLKADSSR